MPFTITCEHCGSAIRCEDEDRGFEVYCNSCALANLVPAEAAEDVPANATEEPAQTEPAAGPPTDSLTDSLAAATAKASIFSNRGTAEAEQCVVGEETCFCGTKVPVRVEDFGGSIYCPKCSTEIRVGDTLHGGKYRVARQAEREDEPDRSLPAGKPRFRLVHSPWALAAMLLILCSAALGGYYTWQNPDAVMASIGFEPAPRPPKKRPPDGHEPTSGEQPDAATQPKENADEPEPDPLKITLEMIEELAKSQDAGEALVQAQVWQESLSDQEVDEKDPRRVRLAELIEQFKARLAPEPTGPPAALTEFRRLVQALADALAAGDLDDAAKAFEAAGAFLDQHREELAPYCRRYLLLKAQLQIARAAIAGVERIAGLLDRADGDQAAGRVTEALQSEAQARFLARTTPMTALEHKSLDQKQRQLTDKLRLARGRRAVEDAEGFNQAGDVSRRNREARRAFSVLAGLPESKIAPLLDRVRSWSEGDESPPDDSAADGELARHIEWRDRYEAALEHYANAEVEQLAAACVRVDEVLTGGDERTAKLRQRNVLMLFNVLEREIIGRLHRLDPNAEENALLEQLSQLRRTLDLAANWKTHHQWRALDGAIRQQGSQLAQRFLDQAVVLAKEDKLNEAIARADGAEGLGDADVARRASALKQEWQAELKLRADRQAQAEARRRIDDLQAAGDRPLELWKELKLFGRRFPDSPHIGEVERLMQEIRQAIEDKAADDLGQIEQMLAERQYVQAREKMNLLGSAPIPPQHRPRADRLLQQFAGLKQRAQNAFLLLGKHKKLFTEESCLYVLDRLPTVLAMDPDHKEARALLERAKRQGAYRAQKLVGSALAFKKHKPNVYVDKLRRAARLDPDGPSGKKARELLGGRS